MNTPLSTIKQWFLELDSEIQKELLCLCSYFHYNDDIKTGIYTDEQCDQFVAYLSCESLGADEVITRSLFTIALLDFAFVGRDTEEGWDITMDRNLDLRSRLEKVGKSGEFIDKMLDNWQHRKYLWINLANSWYELKENELTMNSLDDWYRQSRVK